jgi:hypothetical protein
LSGAPDGAAPAKHWTHFGRELAIHSSIFDQRGLLCNGLCDLGLLHGGIMLAVAKWALGLFEASVASKALRDPREVALWVAVLIWSRILVVRGAWARVLYQHTFDIHIVFVRVNASLRVRICHLPAAKYTLCFLWKKLDR